MNELGGWIKLYDRFWSSSAGSCTDKAQLLAIWLISHAHRKSGWYKGRKIYRGSVAYSARELARQFGWSRDAIRWANRQLDEVGFTTHQTTHHYTISSICNFELYQPTNTPAHTQPTPQQHPSNTPTSPVTLEVRSKKKEEREKITRELNFDEITIQKLQTEFPSVDVDNELKIARGWLANSPRRYTDFHRFFHSWLAREFKTNKPKSIFNPNAAAGQVMPESEKRRLGLSA